MSSSEIRHFSLTGAPFTKEIGDHELWLPTSKKSLVDEIVEAIRARESMALGGDAGVGKNCVLRAVRQALPPKEFRITYCQNATLGRRDFYRHLCLVLGLTPSATAAALFHAVTQHVDELATQRQHPVFIIDEAHLLHPDTLDHLHILMNYEWDSRALLSLVLVGLPELEDRLALRRNRSLYSRLHHRITIDALGPDDTAEYVRMRLQRSGCERELFAT